MNKLMQYVFILPSFCFLVGCGDSSDKVTLENSTLEQATAAAAGNANAKPILSEPVVASKGQWKEGFGQGNLEYFIDQDDVRFYIGCPTKDGSADANSDVTLHQISSDQDIPKFTIDVNGNSYEGPFDTGSRVGEDNFISLLADLRKGDAVVKFNGKSIRFDKGNVADVVPVFGKKFSCNLDV
ncbi:hypothetical protein GALL_276570 [mine drainage metagenome]|uniref:Lipoprotein n=1 Tax=mine drainage metagenome TaxID=410659 RepID=A0A1J5REJ2_9ZZZZ